VNSVPKDSSNAKYYILVSAQPAKCLYIYIMGFPAAMFWLSIIGRIVDMRAKEDGCFEE